MRSLLLENIRSLHNVGSLLRSADGAGFEKVYFTGYTGTPPDRRIEKVSLGAENFISWEKHEDPVALVQRLKKEGHTILALEQTSTSENLLQYEHNHADLCLIVGNEVEGITPALLQEANHTLEIPMHGQKGSLNVSVAGAIGMYLL